MKVLEKVIFDTNKLRNTDPNTFLGNRNELESFSKVSEIIIPEIVIDEIKKQKQRNLESKKQSFLDNPFHWLRKLNKEETEKFDNEAHIEDLISKETIKYSIISLSDFSVLTKMKDLATSYEAPFEKTNKDDKNNSDKGFKDAYIFFTILEYLQKISDKYIFVCTEDWRLKNALEIYENIIVIKDFEEFKKFSISFFYNEYFIKKLQEEINESIKQENIIDFWINTNGNQVLLIDIDGEKIVTEIDSWEIIDFKNKNEYQSDINDLIHSGSFSDTHIIIRKLKPYIHFFSDKEIKEMIEAIFDNYEIKGAMMHWVKEFYWRLFETKKDILEAELKGKTEHLFT